MLFLPESVSEGDRGGITDGNRGRLAQVGVAVERRGGEADGARVGGLRGSEEASVSLRRVDRGATRHVEAVRGGAVLPPGERPEGLDAKRVGVRPEAGGS